MADSSIPAKRAGRRRQDTAVRMYLQPQHRKMKTYTVNSTEMIAMPLFNMVAAAVLGIGIWLFEMSLNIEGAATSKRLFWFGIACMGIAAIAELAFGVFYFIIRRESGERAGT